MVAKPNPRRLLALTAYASLGPITGPLVVGVVRNWRRGDYLLAGLYVLAIPAALTSLAFLAKLSVQAALG